MSLLLLNPALSQTLCVTLEKSVPPLRAAVFHAKGRAERVSRGA